MSTHNICIHEEIRKIFLLIPSLFWSFGYQVWVINNMLTDVRHRYLSIVSFFFAEKFASLQSSSVELQIRVVATYKYFLYSAFKTQYLFLYQYLWVVSLQKNVHKYRLTAERTKPAQEKV